MLQVYILICLQIILILYYMIESKKLQKTQEMMLVKFSEIAQKFYETTIHVSKKFENSLENHQKIINQFHSQLNDLKGLSTSTKELSNISKALKVNMSKEIVELGNIVKKLK